MCAVSIHADRIVAELLERMAMVDGLEAACSVVLERALDEAALAQAVACLARDGRVEVFGVGLPRPEVSVLAGALRADVPGALSLLAAPGPAPLAPASALPSPFPQTVLVPFSAHAVRLHGGVLLPLPQVDERAEIVGELFRRCAPALGRRWQLDEGRSRVALLSRRYELLNGIIDSLPDPVLLTSPDNSIVMANRRAERLFSMSDEDSEGRRRAIQINTLLFSSFLTRAVIGRGDPGARELNLVDPSDGSDLVFEVLSDPLAPGLAPDGAVLSIMRDITDLKRAVTEIEDQVRRSRVAEHQARRERDQLDAILENVSDPILVTDEHSNIILLNREADRLFVVDPGADRQAPSQMAVQANDTRFTTLISDFLLRPEERRVVKLEISDPDHARPLPVEVASSKVLDGRGEPRAIVSILHDLTQAVENERLARELRDLNADLEARVRAATEELEERNRRLEWQSFELERAYRLKSEFLASMSHELRTPINVILGYTSLARERIYGELTPQQEEALGKIYATSQHLLELINDILDLSKIEAGKMPLHLEPVTLGEVVAELATSIEPMLAAKGLQFRTEVEDGLPQLETDRTKLKQILLNLLSNAIKFTHQGTITLSAGRSATEARIRIVVADTGIGIRSDHLDMIFDDFRQVDQSRTREYGGTGLGLSITKKLLTLLGGLISVESEFGKGSRFLIDLPVRTEPASLEDQVRRTVVDSDRAVLRP